MADPHTSTPARFADLELTLDPRDEGLYELRMRFTPAPTDRRGAGERADVDDNRGPYRLPLRVADFRRPELLHHPEAYGEALYGAVFAGEPGAFLDDKLAECTRDGAQLSLRLRVAPGAESLHGLRWELLRRPAQGTQGARWLVTDSGVCFYRNLTAGDLRPGQLKHRRELRILVALADPPESMRADWGLDPLPAARFVDPVLRALDGATSRVRTLGTDGSPPCTLAALQQELLAGQDVLCLVCHGQVSERGEAELFLAPPGDAGDPAGTAVVAADALVQAIRRAHDRPKLVVLLSCDSAGVGGAPDDQLLRALGPRLAEEGGVPAVVAMQGSMPLDTAAPLMPDLLRELRDCRGRVHLALARARRAVQSAPEAAQGWWRPALFMRLRSGRIWYEKGFGRAEQSVWKTLVDHIRESRRSPGQAAGRPMTARERLLQRQQRTREEGCTPVLGLGMLEPYVGPLTELTSRLAHEWRFALERHAQRQLSAIAQFIQYTSHERSHLHRNLEQELCRQLRAHLGQRGGADLPEEDVLELLMNAAAPTLRPGDPYRQLAALGLPLYLTTSPDTRLEQALMEHDPACRPVVGICPWKEELARPEVQLFPHWAHSGELVDDLRPPSPSCPLVYHLFGHLAEPASVVLSEDDHFDFLTGFVRYQAHIPGPVQSAMAHTALLLVGFQLDDLGFRVLFKALHSLEGKQPSTALQHVAAQVEPDEERLLDPEGTRLFLRDYMGSSHFKLYWGTAEQFLGDLLGELESDAGGAQVTR